MTKVRVRFAPSPTGPLHIGGVRTALYNYLFAKKHKGDFILRIEDTDQARLVQGAEDYIMKSLAWLGLNPDESPEVGGPFGPYRQSDRKDTYAKYAWQLVDDGKAYIAFDTPEEIEEMKVKMTEAGVVQPQYNAVMRHRMKNSLSLSQDQVDELIENKVPFVIRIKMPAKEDIRFVDLIRGTVLVHSSTLDDKVLIKSDGMPTYHLANIVDDHLMEITHVIRGEEWLPSAPLHVYLYQSFGWESTMPSFAHLPLILKPDGKGKLSKRDGKKQGIPVFPLEYVDEDQETYKGFREEGYFPESVVNFLSLLGWNPGTEQELFTIDELAEIFSLERIIKGGARFDIDKAKWFNQHYLRKKENSELVDEVMKIAASRNVELNEQRALQVINLMKERVTFIHEMIDNAPYLFNKPTEFDPQVVNKKWSAEIINPFQKYAEALKENENISPEQAKNSLEEILGEFQMPIGKVMQALRVSLSGQGGGPDLMEVISFLGGSEASERIDYALNQLPIKS
ncbi:MAG: glutamate--tRNA ligase [Cyclobacteriaceae bacterium]|nr:glutamate--tRNA ligase [Cyclobacteriaceae bacterium]